LARTAALQKQMDGLLARIGSDASALAGLLSLRDAVTTAGREILLANPVLDFQKLLLIRGGPGFSSNWGGMNRLGNELVVLSPVRPDGEIKTIHKAGGIGDSKLSFDGKRVLFSDGRRIQEINVDGTGLRHISPELEEHVYHYDPCYLPNGKIVFVSTACEQAVPCTGGWHVGNLHVMDADGRNERRLTYDQDHDWNPSVLNSGRVIYTRWEYTDTPHYFSRLLFHMNPDGTEQMEYYGSGSYWPNAMYWAKPIPGHPTKTVCVVSGHHGVARMGELIILDPARGRHEADGVVQRIPGRGRKVEPVIVDGLVMDEWPRFATPYPLAEPGTHRGAGKYFLAAVKMTPHSPWGLYLVDVFDNMTPLLMGGYSNPIPLRPRPRPPVIPSKVDLARKDAVVYMVDVYEGAGIKGFPRGTVKALRIGSHHYRYGGNGDTRAASYEGGWDVKTILGTVPVHADGSAYFRIPANTPIFLQPLDAEGKAQQTMRSWFVGMPGEVVSCVGCHEQQNSVPPNSLPLAALRDPAAITPWHGPARGFSFDREVQPVLDRRCAGCHDGQPRKDGRQLPDFRAKRRHKDFKGNYSPAYMALHPFVRRAGYEADYHMPAPAEWGAETGVLVQMLKKGHHNVRLTAEEWGRLYAWIDFNVPYAANWGESHRPPDPEQVARRVKYKKLLANIDDRDEEPLPLPPVAKFEAPAPESARPAPAKLDGWPLAAEQAQAAQKDAGSPRELVLKLSGDVTMNCALIPAGRFVMGDVAGFPDEYPEAVVAIGRPFYLGQFEVTNDQYALYDSKHDSAYMDARGKDRFTRGYPVNEPKQPVIRVSWHQAMAFCKWLSRRSGHDCTLPTEAEWEHACRAGTATPWAFGSGKSRPNNAANFSDGSLSSWNWGRVEPNYHDGARFSIPGGRYKPNAWGLHDMHGNVAEWTRSVYRPYPYSAATEDGAPARGGLRVVRGGSWNDTLRFGRSASRWRYPAHQPVYNVGFRVLVRPSRVVRR
ncbi:MAG: SUMF1/EgtB/PvdO family nonheme iron enzyme, partial [Candidatus Brocadiae bacterium]|nr:SUMF1/EgtB/PvdO family nonheme iron enzyme [Candidatus Brocadiia bacterium]